MKEKFWSKVVRFLLKILYNFLGEYLEKQIGTLGKNAIHNCLLTEE